MQYHLGATFKDLLKIDETEMELLFIAEIIAIRGQSGPSLEIQLYQ